MSDPLKTRADQITDAFVKFHRANPGVWLMFEKFTLMAIASGKTHYSSASIFERMRWHMDIDTGGGEVLLNNNFRAYYARMFHYKHPEHCGFFRNRKMTSRSKAAYDKDIQVFNTGAPEGEEGLINQLKDL